MSLLTRRRMTTAVLAATASAALVAGCSFPGSGTIGIPGAPGGTGIHELSVDSPIGFGFRVPEGAVLVGPLMRYRSDELRGEFSEELEAALIDQAVAEGQRSLNNAETTDPDELAELADTPEPPYERRRDSYHLIEEQPAPDSTYAFLRVDGDPTTAYRDILTQVREILPDSDVDPATWRDSCTLEENRISLCQVRAEGTASNGRELRVRVTIDPGDLSTRFTPAAAQERPVMAVKVNVIDGAELDQTGSYERTPFEADPEPEDGVDDDYIWPQMDVDEPTDSPNLLDGSWQVPEDTTLLLSGHDPRFAVLFSHQGAILEQTARDWVASHSDRSEMDMDILEDLNEYSTTYSANSSIEGLVARATYVQSARGTYLVMVYEPGMDE